MDQSKFKRIIRSIRETQEEENLCSECFDHLSTYVDLEAAGGDAAEQMPRVKQHLSQCRVCREEYETLLDLVQQEGA